MEKQQLRLLASAVVICLFQNPLKVIVGVTKDDSDQLKAGSGGKMSNRKDREVRGSLKSSSHRLSVAREGDFVCYDNTPSQNVSDYENLPCACLHTLSL